MKDLDELLPRVMEQAPACPEPTAIRHLRDAAIEFCRRTRIWRSTESWTLTTETYECVVVNQEAAIFEISHASLGDTDLEAKTIDWLDKARRGWRDEVGSPRWLTQSSPNTLRVVPKPEEGGTLTVELILVPSIDTMRIPDELANTYSKAIADGALGRILALKTNFMDLKLAVFHAAEFETALGRWSNQIPKGQQKARRRVKARFL